MLAEVVPLRPSADRLADKGRVLDVLQGRRPQILDTLSEGEHFVTKKTDKRGGSIPGAVHLEWTDLLDPKTKKFKGPTELSQLFKEAGVDLAQPTVTYCQSGGRASVMAFGLELMGGRGVANYYRSWAEWGNDETTPVDRPKQK